jgi:Amt family ammonium transporter
MGFIAGAIGYGTGLGVVTGVVAGLLAITAAAGHVEPATAIAIACIAGIICQAAVLLKRRFGSQPAPDPFGVQGVGGLAGAMLTGVFAQKALNHAGADGALFGNLSQLAIQAIACMASGVYAALVTFVILKVIDVAIGLRVRDADHADAGAGLATDAPTVRSPGAA